MNGVINLKPCGVEVSRTENMGKTAKLVSFIVTTRVVIDESGNRDIDEERAYDEAREKIMANAREYLIWDNLESVSDDTEVPYDEKYDRTENMTNETLKVGDKVTWRGGFGKDAPAEATVTEIELCEYGEKYGEPVDSVPWEYRDRIVVSLDNGHWAYGDQLEPKI